ncbi:MAG: hypothetical protein PHQ62_04285, partial [Clostridia bacterium]|nr:hypothetical protein [Clostridia bacterium]
MEDEERLKIKNKYELLKITRENYKNIRPKEIFVSGLVGLGMGHFGCFYLSALNPIFMPEFEFQPLIPNPAIVLTCTA